MFLFFHIFINCLSLKKWGNLKIVTNLCMISLTMCWERKCAFSRLQYWYSKWWAVSRLWNQKPSSQATVLQYKNTNMWYDCQLIISITIWKKNYYLNAQKRHKPWPTVQGLYSQARSFKIFWFMYHLLFFEWWRCNMWLNCNYWSIFFYIGVCTQN